MKSRLLISASLLAMALPLSAQKIDFDNWTNDDRYTETGYVAWNVGTVQSESKTFTDDAGREVTITLSCDEGSSELPHTLKSNWWKDGVQKHSKLVGDCVAVYGLDSDNNTPQLSESATLKLTISGLAAGEHSLLAYLNVPDGNITSVAPIDVAVDGTTQHTGIIMSARAEQPSASGQAYINFTATEGQDVEIAFTSRPAAGQTYSTTGVFLCALVFDRPNPLTTALDPYPASEDMHVNADSKQLTLKWTPASSAVKHHIYFGTSEQDMRLQDTTTEAEYTVQNLTPHNVYYWRVDEENAAGTVFEGDTWTFRARRLAFPGAEGYGRYATGGRGGTVYHVTSLADDPANPQPGTFRYGMTQVKGPRTIVFDVAGTINLTARLTCSDPYVTIAGQTAPGKGIIFKGAPIGVASEGITRFIRMRRGYHNDDLDNINRGLDGLGMAGNNHSIMDHCSVGWTIDEAFSSRNAKNITLQRTLISEALNVANHPNYGSGTAHGYAATIGGDTATYHHNLLAHNSGRNWSMSGGLDGGGAYAGHHDMFNNVCYNWDNRTTDGGTHEGQFVNNYYKMGPASTLTYLLTAQLEGTGSGSQSYYVNGNIRENRDGSQTEDAENSTYRYTTSGGQVVGWTVFVDKPFFESHATIEPARMAFKTVLSDVGASQPMLDDHDRRMVTETLEGTYSFTGSVSGKPGLIDREADAGGYESFPEETRPASFDTDQDGMPDWWERLKGLNPNVADNNSDADGDGYTALEEYLNWLAEPHYTIQAGETTNIDLKPLFAGYDNDPYYGTEFYKDGYTINVSDNILEVTAPENTEELLSIQVTGGDNDNVGDMTRTINLYVTTSTTGIDAPGLSVADDASTTWLVYSVNGVLMKDGKDISQLPAGVYILKGTNNGKVKTYKAVKK